MLRLDLDDLRLSRQLAGVGHLNRRDVRLLLLLLLLLLRLPVRQLLFDGNPVDVDAGQSRRVRDNRVA